MTQTARVAYHHEERVFTNAEGARVQLSHNAARLVEALLVQHGHVISREELRHAVWGHDGVSEDAVNHAVSRLRKKLKRVDHWNEWQLVTVPQVGYRLTLSPCAASLWQRCCQWWQIHLGRG